MEPYRHALYRYSTGQGFNVNVDVPQETTQVASYKMEPLLVQLDQPDTPVDLKREADRVSMQMEAGMQEIKVLGYTPTAGKRLKELKSRVELMKHLLTTYPVRYIKRADLDRLYELYFQNVPGMDNIIKKVVEQNKGVLGTEDYVGTALKVRKGYPLYDQFGRRLTKEQKKEFEKDKSLSGLGTTEGTNWIKWIAIGLVVAALWKTAAKTAKAS